MVKIKKRTDKKNLLSERNLKMNKRLKAAREAAGKTQAEVAKLVGMSERGYRRIENSASYAGVAISIARVLNTTVEQIFSLTEDVKLTDA
jgi:DNA-binding XRE family transcriptional regulator